MPAGAGGSQPPPVRSPVLPQAPAPSQLRLRPHYEHCGQEGTAGAHLRGPQQLFWCPEPHQSAPPTHGGLPASASPPPEERRHLGSAAQVGIPVPRGARGCRPPPVLMAPPLVAAPSSGSSPSAPWDDRPALPSTTSTSVPVPSLDTGGPEPPFLPHGHGDTPTGPQRRPAEPVPAAGSVPFLFATLLQLPKKSHRGGGLLCPPYFFPSAHTERPPPRLGDPPSLSQPRHIRPSLLGRAGEAAQPQPPPAPSRPGAAAPAAPSPAPPQSRSPPEPP